MTTGYWIAWLVLYVFGIGLILLCVYPLRKRFYIAFFVGAIGVFWMLVPIPFNEHYWAPLFVTLTFQLFFDPDSSYAVSATAATLGTLTISVATLLLFLLGSTYRHRSVFSRLGALPFRKSHESEKVEEDSVINVDTESEPAIDQPNDEPTAR